MEWDLSTFILATLAIGLGSLMQAATGLGGGLINVPLLALISYSLVPGPLIFASMSLSSVMVWHGRKYLQMQGMGRVVGGLIVGTLLASWYITRIPVNQLGLLFGGLILLAVMISLFLKTVPHNNVTLLGGGLASGVMGASAGIGAPVLALLYQNIDARALRPTLALLYLLSSLMMVAALHFAGRFGAADLQSGFMLIPGFVLGFFLSPRLARWIDKGKARPVVLVVSVVSALVLIGQSLLAG